MRTARRLGTALSLLMGYLMSRHWYTGHQLVLAHHILLVRPSLDLNDQLRSRHLKTRCRQHMDRRRHVERHHLCLGPLRTLTHQCRPMFQSRRRSRSPQTFGSSRGLCPAQNLAKCAATTAPSRPLSWAQSTTASRPRSPKKKKKNNDKNRPTEHTQHQGRGTQKGTAGPSQPEPGTSQRKAPAPPSPQPDNKGHHKNKKSDSLSGQRPNWPWQRSQCIMSVRPYK